MEKPPPIDDRGLEENYLRGDPTAIGVVDGWIDIVLRDDFRSLKDEWEDLRQEVRVRVFRNLDRGAFNGRSALRTYVHRITMNVCIDFARKAHRIRERNAGARREAPQAGRGEPWVSALAARDFLVKILDGLHPDDRLMIRLVFAEHCSYEEVAGRLGISESAVKSRMFRCKERILRRRRQLLEEGGPRT